MRKRTIARECTLKILYQAEITRRDFHIAFKNFWDNDKPKDKTIFNFNEKLIKGIARKIVDIDQNISKFATNWQLKRMAVIDRNILRIGTFEILFAEKIPPKVAINEAVELAKKYGDTDSSKFVNGILDKIHKSNLPSSS